MTDVRYITLSDGTGMGDELIIFKTDAPAEELKNLERRSCQVYLDGGSSEDIPIWSEVITEKGYLFEYVDSHVHVSPYNTSGEWIKKNYLGIAENYVIENQT